MPSRPDCPYRGTRQNKKRRFRPYFVHIDAQAVLRILDNHTGSKKAIQNFLKHYLQNNTFIANEKIKGLENALFYVSLDHCYSD